MPVKVLTDHKGLEYFMTTKKLTPRQARWAEFLSKFNFKVTYQTGKKNDKADALTRKPNEQPANEEDKRQEHRMQVLLPPKRIEIQPIEVTNEPKDKGVEAKQANEEEKAEELGRLHAAEPQSEHKESVETKDLQTLPEQVKELNQNDLLFTEIREYLANPVDKNRPTVYLRGSRAANGLLYKDNKLWVAKNLRLDVIREVHDQPAVGHSGVRRTMLLIQQHFFWPRMKQDVDRYIRNCHICRRAKAPRNCYNGTLKPLLVPERPWTDITMDFVTGLLEC